MICCPTCKRPLDIGESIKLSDLPKTVSQRSQRDILEILAAAYPKTVSIDALISNLYARRYDGGPNDPKQVVRVLIWQLRKSLPEHNWTILNDGGGKGNPSLYRLAATETRKP